MTLDLSDSISGAYDPPPVKKDDTLHGDFVSSEKIIYGQITSYSGVAIGRGTQDSISQSAPSPVIEELNDLFNALFRQLQVAASTPFASEQTWEQAMRLRLEILKGPDASLRVLEHLLHELLRSAPGPARSLIDGLNAINLGEPLNQALQIGGGSDESAPQTAFAALVERIQDAPLDDTRRARLLDCLRQIDAEVRKENQAAAPTKAGFADTRRVQEALHQLLSEGVQLPDLPRLLSAWLVEDPGVPRSVRMLAKQIIR